MTRDHTEKAERLALARALKLWPSAAPHADGADTVRAALDDVMFLRECAANMFAEASEDGEDDGVLARLLRARVHAHIRNQPNFEPRVSAELADLNEAAREEAEADDQFEFECNAHAIPQPRTA